MLLAALCLFLSAAQALLGAPEPTPWPTQRLLDHGWQESDAAHCAGARAGTYYEIENDAAAAEIFYVGAGKSWVSHLPLPEEPYQCREIQEPHFIEEI